MKRAEDYPSLRSMLTRAHMRNYWMDNPQVGWEVGGNPKRNCQCLLIDRRHGLSLRLLKENRRLSPGGTPAAGHSTARREAWAQPLPDDFLALPASPTRQELTELFLLWDRTIVTGEPRVSVRVVHTIAPGVFGRAVPLDMSFEIEPGGTMFDALEFPGDPDEPDLWAEIDDDDEAEGDGTDGNR